MFYVHRSNMVFELHTSISSQKYNNRLQELNFESLLTLIETFNEVSYFVNKLNSIQLWHLEIQKHVTNWLQNLNLSVKYTFFRDIT